MLWKGKQTMITEYAVSKGRQNKKLWRVANMLVQETQHYLRKIHRGFPNHLIAGRKDWLRLHRGLQITRNFTHAPPQPFGQRDGRSRRRRRCSLLLFYTVERRSRTQNRRSIILCYGHRTLKIRFRKPHRELRYKYKRISSRFHRTMTTPSLTPRAVG